MGRAFSAEVAEQVAEWFAAHRAALASITRDTQPSQLIALLGDDLLVRFKPTPLLDEYDIYEQLLSYWHETMHDDVFLVMHEDWVGAAKPRATIEDKDRKLSETPDLMIGTGKKASKFKTDLVPPALLVARYFADEQAKVDELVAEAATATAALEEVPLCARTENARSARNANVSARRLPVFSSRVGQLAATSGRRSISGAFTSSQPLMSLRRSWPRRGPPAKFVS